MKRLNPLNDYIFQKVMGEKGSEEQLLSFLKAVLSCTGKDNIESIEISGAKTTRGELIDGKTIILDVKALLYDGTKVNIEVQLRNVGNMGKRSLFYWAKDFANSLKEGEDYDELPKIININIVGYEFLETEEFHEDFQIRSRRTPQLVLTDALEIHFLDMVKFRRLKDKDIVNNPLHRWLTFFDKNSSLETVEKLIKMDTAIQKAQKKIEYVSQDEESFRFYEAREKEIHDYVSGMSSAVQKGKLEEKLEIATKMVLAGFDISFIKEMTGLTIEQIENLKSEDVCIK